jgi:hypothetical protein
MNYSFKKYNWDETTIFGVQSDLETLNNIGSWGWTPQKVQDIIDGVENSRESEFNNAYKWANEDVHLISFEHGVFFHDLMADRAGIQRDKQDLDLTHDEFIQFLEDFKEFVTQNS